MNIQPMFEIQKKNNDNLMINSELMPHKLQVRKNLEFEIKLGDLASETKCFHYLMENPSDVDIDLVFHKYISCISQILILGIDNKYSDLISVSMTPNDYCLSDQFLNLYFDINDLITSPSMDHYLTLFQDFLSLGLTLGFSEEQIQNYFIKDFNPKIVL